MSCQAPGKVNHTTGDPGSSTVRPSTRTGSGIGVEGWKVTFTSGASSTRPWTKTSSRSGGRR